MLVLPKLEITIMYCYETVILPSLDVTSPNVMLSTQCLPAYSLVLGGGRKLVIQSSIEIRLLFTDSSARFQLMGSTTARNP